MTSENYKIYDEINVVLILREKGDTTLIRIVWETISAEFFYINLLKLKLMINSNCKCAKVDKMRRLT